MERSLSFLFIFVSLVSSAYASPTPEINSSSRLRVLTYNLWGAPFSGKLAKKRIPRIATQLASIDADIVSLNETFDGCFAGEQPEWVLKGSRYPYYAMGPRPSGQQCLNSGLMILSKFPILKSDTLAYNDCSGADCFARKGVLYTKIQLPNGTLVDAYTTHLNAGDSTAPIRMKQIVQINQFVRRHSGEGLRPILFMGDLNARPDSSEMETIRSTNDLYDSHDEYHAGGFTNLPGYMGYTSDPLRNANLAGRRDPTPKRLDYILFRQTKDIAIQVLGSRLAYEEPSYRERPLSDHFGVIAELDIQALLPFSLR